MDREYTDRVPEKLTQRVLAESGADRFRRRAVLTKGNARWELVCCTVEAFRPGESIPDPVPSRRYPKTFLHEEFLTREQCMQFAHDIQEGRVSFDDIDLQRGQEHARWSTEILPVGNDNMERAGCVISMQFEGGGGRTGVRTLLSAELPYYADEEDATRDWLPLLVYHGHGDSRNGHVLFLLPETRAYITDLVFSDGTELDIAVAGTQIASHRS